jgi:hypothetical protein
MSMLIFLFKRDCHLEDDELSLIYSSGEEQESGEDEKHEDAEREYVEGENAGRDEEDEEGRVRDKRGEVKIKGRQVSAMITLQSCTLPLIDATTFRRAASTSCNGRKERYSPSGRARESPRRF